MNEDEKKKGESLKNENKEAKTEKTSETQSSQPGRFEDEDELLKTDSEQDDAMETDHGKNEESKTEKKETSTPLKEEKKERKPKGDSKAEKKSVKRGTKEGGVKKNKLSQKKEEEKNLKKALKGYKIPKKKIDQPLIPESSSSSSGSEEDEMEKMRNKQELLIEKLEYMSRELEEAKKAREEEAIKNASKKNQDEEKEKCRKIMHMIAEISEGQGHFQTINKFSDSTSEPCPDYNEGICQRSHPHPYPNLGKVERICAICKMGANVNNLHPKYECKLYETVREAREKDRMKKQEEKKKKEMEKKTLKQKVKMPGKHGKKGGKWFRK